METLKKDVQQKFDKMREAINLREKLLLRQIDAISSISNHKNNKNFVTTGTTNNNNYNSTTTTVGGGGGNGNSIDDIKFVTENEETIFSYLRTFGKFSLDNINFANDLYVNEDYILPNVDHEIMYKQMPIKDNSSNSNDSMDEEKIIVDFSNNRKLINDNVNNINDSIINITLNEAKELIKRTEQVPLINYNVQNIYQSASIVSIDTSSSSSTISSQIIDDNEKYNTNSSEPLKLTTNTSLQSSNQSGSGGGADSAKTKNKLSSHKKSFKPKITINNCNGTINLKNISNLIINCANQDTMNMDNKKNNGKSPTDSIAESQPIFSSITENDNGNIQDEEQEEEFDVDDDDYEETNNSNTITTTTRTTTTKDNEENCEFYNRLISEIKNTLKQQPQHKHTNNKSTTTDNIPIESTSNSSSKTNNNNNNDNNSNTNRKFLLRNFENLKIVLETTQNDDNQTPTQHPVQIEQWLAEIISETEVEPLQHTEILETKNTRNNSILLQND